MDGQVVLSVRDHIAELGGNVLVCVGAAVAPWLGDDADGVCPFDPLAGRQCKAIQSCLVLNPSNSTGLKTELFNCSQMPRNSMVFLFLRQLRIKSSVLSGSLYLIHSFPILPIFFACRNIKIKIFP